ncbi:MAG: zinc ABC transporter solute-binding protein [Desulfobacteraceae bacterium]|nr:zinc ABC transporter solute-binding protein [Desulfobacteraceae bacterium]
MDRFFINALLSCIIVLLTSPLFANDRLPVFVSIAPQKFFVQQIGKEMVDVNVMVRPGADPHTYEPRPRQMVAISKAKLYFAIGVGFEKANLKKIVSANPKLKVIHTDHGIQKIPMPNRNDHGMSHHREDQKTDHKEIDQHQGLDPHIWLSPKLVIVQAKHILTALMQADPENKTGYKTNYTTFVKRIKDLDHTLDRLFEKKTGLSFMVFHPAWGYFAHAYRIHQVPVEIEGKDPKPGQLKELIEHARKNHINVVFVQPQFSSKSAKLLARQIQGRVIFADPLAAEWMANIEVVAKKFKEALK